MISTMIARRSCWRDRMVTPGAFQAASRSSASPTKLGIDVVELGVSSAANSRLTAFHTLQCCFPAFFKLCSDKPIIRIAGGVASLGKGSLVVRLLQFQLHDASSLALQLHMPALGFKCRLNRHRLHSA